VASAEESTTLPALMQAQSQAAQRLEILMEQNELERERQKEAQALQVKQKIRELESQLTDQRQQRLQMRLKMTEIARMKVGRGGGREKRREEGEQREVASGNEFT
jgi:CTP-dependent riboflavin kinase